MRSHMLSGNGIRRLVSSVAVGTLVACGGSEPTAVGTNPPPTSPTTYPGFDAAVYPGTSAMRAWLSPSSPYYWAGYYLGAPCHRDLTWVGQRATLASMGWGITAIYVGQQDWTQIPDIAVLRAAVDVPSNRTGAARTVAHSIAAVTCSASLLSSSQGTSEAADAIAAMKADGFPDGSTIYLDIEYVTSVTTALRTYMHAWIVGVLRDGHYKPGVYAAKSNVSALHDEAVAAYADGASSVPPPFWIASSLGFSMSASPTAVGFDFAKLWQGMFDVKQTWNGVSLTIDVDVATAKSPSSP